jgi:hypothetical protein
MHTRKRERERGWRGGDIEREREKEREKEREINKANNQESIME